MARQYDPDAPTRPIIKTPHRVPDSAREGPPTYRPQAPRSGLAGPVFWGGMGFALGALLTALALWH